jgi:threonine/homoserine/homoserine lactone efflux protein
MLISHSSLLVFVTGAAVLLMIPGAAITYIVSRNIGQRRAAGLVSVMGIVVGTLLHVVAATLGLSALLASSVFAFQFVKHWARHI